MNFAGSFTPTASTTEPMFWWLQTSAKSTPNDVLTYTVSPGIKIDAVEEPPILTGCTVKMYEPLDSYIHRLACPSVLSGATLHLWELNSLVGSFRTTATINGSPQPVEIGFTTSSTSTFTVAQELFGTPSPRSGAITKEVQAANVYFPPFLQFVRLLPTLPTDQPKYELTLTLPPVISPTLTVATSSPSGTPLGAALEYVSPGVYTVAADIINCVGWFTIRLNSASTGELSDRLPAPCSVIHFTDYTIPAGATSVDVVLPNYVDVTLQILFRDEVKAAISHNRGSPSLPQTSLPLPRPLIAGERLEIIARDAKGLSGSVVAFFPADGVKSDPPIDLKLTQNSLTGSCGGAGHTVAITATNRAPQTYTDRQKMFSLPLSSAPSPGDVFTVTCKNPFQNLPVSDAVSISPPSTPSTGDAEFVNGGTALRVVVRPGANDGTSVQVSIPSVASTKWQFSLDTEEPYALYRFPAAFLEAVVPGSEVTIEWIYRENEGASSVKLTYPNAYSSVTLDSSSFGQDYSLNLLSTSQPQYTVRSASFGLAFSTALQNDDALPPAFTLDYGDQRYHVEYTPRGLIPHDLDIDSLTPPTTLKLIAIDDKATITTTFGIHQASYQGVYTKDTVSIHHLFAINAPGVLAEVFHSTRPFPICTLTNQDTTGSNNLRVIPQTRIPQHFDIHAFGRTLAIVGTMGLTDVFTLHCTIQFSPNPKLLTHSAALDAPWTLRQTFGDYTIKNGLDAGFKLSDITPTYRGDAWIPPTPPPQNDNMVFYFQYESMDEDLLGEIVDDLVAKWNANYATTEAMKLSPQTLYRFIEHSDDAFKPVALTSTGYPYSFSTLVEPKPGFFSTQGIDLWTSDANLTPFLSKFSFLLLRSDFVAEEFNGGSILVNPPSRPDLPFQVALFSGSSLAPAPYHNVPNLDAQGQPTRLRINGANPTKQVPSKWLGQACTSSYECLPTQPGFEMFRPQPETPIITMESLGARSAARRESAQS